MRHRLIATLIAVSVAGPAVANFARRAVARLGGGQPSQRQRHVRCRVSFQRLSTTSFSVSSQCAAETGRYDVRGRVVASGGNRYSGPVQGEGVTGTALIVQSGNRLSVTVTSRRGTAKLSLSRL